MQPIGELKPSGPTANPGGIKQREEGNGMGSSRRDGTEERNGVFTDTKVTAEQCEADRSREMGLEQGP